MGKQLEVWGKRPINWENIISSVIIFNIPLLAVIPYLFLDTLKQQFIFFFVTIAIIIISSIILIVLRMKVPRHKNTLTFCLVCLASFIVSCFFLGKQREYLNDKDCSLVYENIEKIIRKTRAFKRSLES